ncbi:hypothetical protein 1 [Xinzhou nematode virus 7]|uniref:hypothetical protein 1 n=1 Tax=Xinzhou nematode virus 7 TaxID=1923775 RepID=UPI00090B5FE5|nr:hypothetical protein 1 [Xinzhou nematode virus 7]APG76648.1 hypothetical protein 1 [Xinzhou nematode virus 7]
MDNEMLRGGRGPPINQPRAPPPDRRGGAGRRTRNQVGADQLGFRRGPRTQLRGPSRVRSSRASVARGGRGNFPPPPPRGPAQFEARGMPHHRGSQGLPRPLPAPGQQQAAPVDHFPPLVPREGEPGPQPVLPCVVQWPCVPAPPGPAGPQAQPPAPPGAVNCGAPQRHRVAPIRALSEGGEPFEPEVGPTLRDRCREYLSRRLVWLARTPENRAAVVRAARTFVSSQDPDCLVRAPWLSALIDELWFDLRVELELGRVRPWSVALHEARHAHYVEGRAHELFTPWRLLNYEQSLGLDQLSAYWRPIALCAGGAGLFCGAVAIGCWLGGAHRRLPFEVVLRWG